MRGLKTGLAGLSAIIMSACHTASADTAATLVSDDPQTMQVLKSTLASAMKKARVELGAGNLTQNSVVSVLPPRDPFNMNNPALPEQFDIRLRQGACYVVKRNTGEAYMLEGIDCQPAPATQ